MNPIADAPITVQTFTDFEALRDRLTSRLDKIARAVHLIREEGWPYREKKGSFDRWVNLKDRAASFDKYETTTWDYTTQQDTKTERLTAEYDWWCGDSHERVYVQFPLEYLDMTDDEIAAIENHYVAEAKRKHDEKAAEAAEKAAVTKAANLAAKREAALAHCQETIPGFDDLAPEQQEAILSAALKG